MPRIGTGGRTSGQPANLSKQTQPKLEGYRDVIKHRKLFYKRVPGLDMK